MDWFRLHHGTCPDPKWRIVSRRSKEPVSNVLAVWLAMLECASQSEPRGILQNWSDEDVGVMLDLDQSQVQAIREAMQGKTLEGDKLTGWKRRQPIREDGSAERAKAWRERNRTQPNATERTNGKANARTTAQTKPNTDKIDKKEEIEKIETVAYATVPARTLDTISRIQTRMEFDGEFWPLCPHQTGKTDAYAAFHEARQSASLSDICDGMRRYAETLKRPKAPQPMNPANWLQKQRWTDKPMEPMNATDSIDILTLRGAAGWAAAGAITRGAFDQPPPTRPGFGGDYGGSVEATIIDCDAHEAGCP